MVILNLYGIPFHAVVVFRPEHDILFKSASTYCAKNEPKVIEPLKNALDNDYSQSRYNFMRLEDIS